MKLNRKNTHKGKKVKSTGDLARDVAEALEAEEAAALIAAAAAPPAFPPMPLDRHAIGVPKFPTIGAGEWDDILATVEPHVTVELSYGAFVWLWDVVELRVQKYCMGINKLSPKYRQTYEQAVFGALEELRAAALHHFRPNEPPPEPEPKKATTTAKTKKKKKPKRIRFDTS